MKLRHLVLSACAAMLAACATSTPYQEASKPGGFDGFSQTLIENNRARVTFGGNSLTERDTVENYLLFRAAELAVERGYDTFKLSERDVEEKTHLQSTGASSFYDPYFGYSFYNPSYGWSRYSRYSSFGGFGRRGFGSRGFGHSSFGFGGRGLGYDVREITKYRASAEVIFGRGLKQPGQDNVFNAREVIENLGPTITYPEQKA